MSCSKLTGNSYPSAETTDVLVGLNDEGQTILTVTHERDFADYARRQVHLDGGIVERNFVNEYPRRPDLTARAQIKG